MRKFLLNIAQGKIHNGILPCAPAMRMAEANKKWFDTYIEPENNLEGDSKKGVICNRCFKNKDDALKLEKLEF